MTITALIKTITQTISSMMWTFSRLVRQAMREYQITPIRIAFLANIADCLNTPVARMFIDPS
uniref:Uncharacterized protein n=1 Tax=viral metagenome TaxID=1070528 RepID=A0A6M3ILU6_9ZZZZ